MRKLFSTLLIVSACFALNAQRREVQLSLLQTSDIHGAFFPYDFINNKPMSGSLARISSIVNEKREASKNVVLLDNGDILQGQPTVYYYNFIDTASTHLYLRVMDYLKYDAAGVGNHDIETGHAVYDKIFAQSKIPILAANAVRLSSGDPYFSPYTVVERDGIRIAVIGLITPAIPKWLPEDIWRGIDFEDMLESASKWMKVVREKENPHIVVGLFHAGHNFRYAGEDENTAKNENASLLVAQRVPGFDAIFIGHDHDRYMEKVANTEGDSVLIIDPASGGRFLSEVAVSLSMDGDKVVAKKLSGNLIDASKSGVDSAFMQAFAADYKKVESFVSQRVGTFTKAISSRPAFFGPSEFIDLVHRIQLDITKADISFTAPLSMDTKIEQGDVYVRDMFKLYRYENLLYTMSLTGKEIEGFLEHSYSIWANHMHNADEHLLLMRSEAGERTGRLLNAYYNFDSAAGICYTVDVSQPAGSRVKVISMADGSAFLHDKTYTVAINSYRGNGGGDHLTKGAGIAPDQLSKRIRSSTDKDLRYYLMQWIEQQGTVTPSLLHEKEWEFIPTEWTVPAAQRDYKLLFGEE